MNRPRSSDFVVGARATVWTASAFAVLTTLSWFGPHGVSWFVVLPALLFCRASFAAKRRVTAWRQWRAAWNEIAEPPTTQAAPPPARPAPGPAQAKQTQDAPAPAKRKPLRIPRAALIAGWLLLFAWLKSRQGDSSTPSLGVGALCFFALALWGLLSATRKAGRWLLAPARPRVARKAANVPEAAEERDNATDADGNAIVAQCLPVPTARPSGHVRNALPAYCRDLLGRRPHEAAGKDA